MPKVGTTSTAPSMRKSGLFLKYCINLSLLPSLTFRWLFIPWLQTELDAWVEQFNDTRKRADRNKVLPHGIPNEICMYPERFGCLDFKVYFSHLYFLL